MGGSWCSTCPPGAKVDATIALAYAEAHPSEGPHFTCCGDGVRAHHLHAIEPVRRSRLFVRQGRDRQGQHPAAWAAYCDYIRDTSDDL